MAILPDKFLNLSECVFDSIDKSYQPDSNDYQRFTAKKPLSQLFDLDLVTVRLPMASAFELVAWLIDNGSGIHGIFSVRNPFDRLLPPSEIKPISSRASISQFAKSVPAENFTPMIVGALKPGSFFTFGNHAKVYMVTNSPNANASGQSTITFTPGVYEDVPAGTPINYGPHCYFQVSCKADVQSLTASVSNQRKTPITIPVRERAS